MNRINELFDQKQKDILSIYFTAGYPNLEDTLIIAKALEHSGADMVEIGMPYSDPIADGPTIQESNQVALNNGMTIGRLFGQLMELRPQINIPVILMGYINPIMQYGFEKFFKMCKKVGVDGLIIPDLPILEYEKFYKELMIQNDLKNIFLITPQTPDQRIRQIDELTDAFIYMVSSASITGAKKEIEEDQRAYFERIDRMNLSNPKLIGFGISNHDTFSAACTYANGAIIGSAFIKMLSETNEIEKDISSFVTGVLGN